MTKNILLFRTDRIGDFLLTCPTIKTIKELYPDSNINIVTSNKNYPYVKTFNFFKNVYKFPQKNLWEKIKFFNMGAQNDWKKFFLKDRLFSL